MPIRFQCQFLFMLFLKLNHKSINDTINAEKLADPAKRADVESMDPLLFLILLKQDNNNNSKFL
ncbi:hypothetical protein ACIQGW_12380 [Lysinibacillus xylanilyticus]|uniref:hypothetical protein n=1 Tax=Lysinibacillus xylanilyticus TaxID=582475 RepID=UPI003828F759